MRSKNSRTFQGPRVILQYFLWQILVSMPSIFNKPFKPCESWYNVHGWQSHWPGGNHNVHIHLSHIPRFKVFVYDWEYKDPSGVWGGIEKSVLRITDWHHEACRWQTVIARHGVFNSILTRIMDSFACSSLNTYFCFGKNMKKTSRKSWIRWDVTWMTTFLTLQWCHGSTCGRRVIFPKGWYGYVR